MWGWIFIWKKIVYGETICHRVTFFLKESNVYNFSKKNSAARNTLKGPLHVFEGDRETTISGHSKRETVTWKDLTTTESIKKKKSNRYHKLDFFLLHATRRLTTWATRCSKMPECSRDEVNCDLNSLGSKLVRNSYSLHFTTLHHILFHFISDPATCTRHNVWSVDSKPVAAAAYLCIDKIWLSNHFTNSNFFTVIVFVLFLFIVAAAGGTTFTLRLYPSNSQTFVVQQIFLYHIEYVRICILPKVPIDFHKLVP